ncbi:MAG: prolyl oligopeptidase family serine peptidase [Planctomycetales bacterium]|nr:prolyl oligopeptidase family serine peptidase [Planctomycetales bacterium]
MLSRTSSILAVMLLAGPVIVFADGPQDNIPNNVRRVPALGIEVPAEQRDKLQAGIDELTKSIQSLATSKDARVRGLIPDVAVYHKAVHDALKYQEFFNPNEIKIAFDLLAEGQQRAKDLAAGNAPWTKAKGLVVRGYISKIDGSIQPYGLVVPESYNPDGGPRHRLDIWFHGRGETLSELSFVQGRRTQVGTFAPADTIVLHPYGRYCNANKFAGEVDVFEALDSTKSRYRIDDDRISVRGFSMGGAACWQFAVHDADRWFAANPGAGFSETPQFLKVFQKEELKPTWWEQRLWRMYNCDEWATNLHHCPTVAYSGEEDSQKQAADVMQAALAKVGIDMTHIIGPKTKHAYHPEARDEVARRLDLLAVRGRNRVPSTVSFVSHTLKYNRMHWVAVDGIAEHWQSATVEARLTGPAEVTVTTHGVTDLTLAFDSGFGPFPLDFGIDVKIDKQLVVGPQSKSDRSWSISLHRDGDKWKAGRRPDAGLRKRHNLQGPIDDAFMDSFVFVKPTGKAKHAAVGSWAAGELDRAIEHWRRHFRGEARVKLDTEVTDADIASSHLILWGDAASNKVLARVIDKLPIRWTDTVIQAGDGKFAADQHALIAIHPNPLNPQRYIVLNSSFTFRDFAYLNNARQVPMLPDWAVVDLRTPPNAVWPGKVAKAGFFGEQWQYVEPQTP